MAWNVPALFAAGAKLTASQLNQIRDSLLAVGDPGTAFTTSWTGSTTNPAIGNGTISAVYNQAGKRVWFSIQVTMGSTTTFGSGSWSFTLPVTARLGSGVRFTAAGRDASAAATWPLAGEMSTSGTSIIMRAWPTTAGAQFLSVQPTVPFTWATSDVLTVSGSYEAA